jgi:hypothetical protein
VEISGFVFLVGEGSALAERFGVRIVRQLAAWELRNKMMRIGLHGLRGYIKLERGRNGGTKGGHPSERRSPCGAPSAFPAQGSGRKQSRSESIRVRPDGGDLTQAGRDAADAD